MRKSSNHGIPKTSTPADRSGEGAVHPVKTVLAGARRWAALFSQLFGPVDLARVGGGPMEGSIVSADLWRLRLCRIELSPHRITLPPGLARPGAHPFNHVRFQTAGTSFFEQDGQTIAIEPGDCLAYNLSRPHMLWSPERTSYDAVTLPIDLVRLQGVPVELLWARKVARPQVDDVGMFAQAMLRTLLDAPPMLPLSAAASVAQALLDLLNATFSHDIAGPERFSRAAMTRFRARAYIADHLREADLTIAQVAAAIGCSTRYLQAIFADEGGSPARHMWQSRLERCREELESPAGDARSVTDIAFSWGYSSASHFTRSFRAHFGFPPSAARARRRDASKTAPG